MIALSTGSVYNFATKAPAILGANYSNAKLVAIMDFETAVSVDNVDILHKSIMPLLPAGTEANPEVLTYYLFKLNNGARKIFALEWITESSIVSVTQMIVNFKILVNSSADIKNIKESLNKLGLYSYEAMVL